MMFLLKLLTGAGLSEAAAGWVIKGVLILAVVGTLWVAYDGVYAEPRRNLATTRTTLDTTLRDLGACTTRSGEWEAAAGACTAQVTVLQGRCAMEAAAATRRAREAWEHASSRTRALLLDPAVGPVAMNRFFTEVYQ